MFLTLIIITQAVAEWVEISQQHYRKPIHTHSIHNPFTASYEAEVEETTRTWAYNNKSVSDYNWTKAPIMQSQQTQDDKYANLNDDEFDLKTNYGPSRTTVRFSDNIKPKGIIEKVPNIGNVKRIQLNNTHVKSPVVNIKANKETEAKNRYEEFPLYNEQRPELLGPKKVTDTTSNRRRIYLNTLGNSINSEHHFPINKEEVFTTEAQILRKRPQPELKDHMNPPTLSRKPTTVTQIDDFIQNEKIQNRFQEIEHSKIPRVTEKKQIFTTPSTNIDETTILKHQKELNKQSVKQTHVDFDYEISSDNINGLPRPSNKNPQAEYDKNTNKVIDNDRTILKNGEQMEVNANSSLENEINDRNFEYQQNKNIDKEKENTLKATKSENKLGSMENLIKIMKVVADTISQNTRRSFGGKMRYLHELKDSILDNIAERIDATWPDDDVTIPHRRSRSAQALPRGHHVQFPSSESALMTISFLTFAVFLIKLVLQIIHTYKNKSMMVTPVMVAGRTVFNNRGNH